MSANSYGTPRTVPPGRLSHSLAFEVIGTHDGDTNVHLPRLPTYTIRNGVTEDVDVGVRFVDLTSLMLDAKLNMVKSEHFDFAVDPGVQGFHFSVSHRNGSAPDTTTQVDGAYLHLPLLFGINLARSVTIMPTAGILYGIATAKVRVHDGDPDADRLRPNGGNIGLIGRFGLGFDFRLGASWALHPEITVLKGFEHDASGYLYTAGLGFNFGALPQY